jgi:hypothetical protein
VPTVGGGEATEAGGGGDSHDSNTGIEPKDISRKRRNKFFFLNTLTKLSARLMK